MVVSNDRSARQLEESIMMGQYGTPRRLTETSLVGKGSPYPDDLEIIHRQHENCGTLDGGLANQIWAIPLEMATPLVTSRIEKLRDIPGDGIDSRYDWSLMEIVVKSGQCQVSHGRVPAVLAATIWSIGNGTVG